MKKITEGHCMPIQNNNFEENLWKQAQSIAIEPIAAGLAIIPTFYGFQVKTALQRGVSIPKYKPLSALKDGLRASPLIAAMISSQRIGQMALDQAIQKQFGCHENFITAITSSAVIGVACTPAMVIFTGMTQRKSAINSLKDLSLKQFGASAAIEVGFLAGMGATGPMIKLFQQKFGNAKSVEYGGAFSSGFIGAMAGHAGDSAMTMWQNTIKIENLKQLGRGAITRSISVGSLNCIYRFVKDVSQNIPPQS